MCTLRQFVILPSTRAEFLFEMPGIIVDSSSPPRTFPQRTDCCAADSLGMFTVLSVFEFNSPQSALSVSISGFSPSNGATCRSSMAFESFTLLG
ncbi:unnamed protein product [Heligmosomoides polygyrus]|uniref:Secreted protein n=1 Tax=Heligmosomoides polygyrus TaxID=6339 RepID=A0A183FTV8_HELPZ|nr:unnamed protein product [Heligmosomoides polygyrus]